MWSPAAEDEAEQRGRRIMTVGREGSALRLVSCEPTQLGQSLLIQAGPLAQKVTLPLIGAYQAANALVAAGLVIATGGDIQPTLANPARPQPVRGRPGRPSSEGPSGGKWGGARGRARGSAANETK